MRDDDKIDPEIDGELLGVLAAALPAERPSPGRRDALLRAIATTSRFERFAARVGALCDLGADATQRLLASVDDVARWITGPAQGVDLFSIDAGPRLANAVCGFVRIAPGASFPRHAHAGDEVALVLAGGFTTDDGHTVRAGEELPMKAGSAHRLTALPGPDLLYLVVVDKGVIFDGEDTVAGPNDPRV